jgi:hypothetical protein
MDLITMRCVLLLTAVLLPATMIAQPAPDTSTILIQTTSMPKVFLRHPLRIELKAQGGTAPLRWEVTGGDMPPGLTLSPDGVLSGIPNKLGKYSFTVTVRDSGRPPHERNQELTLVVTAPLLVEWSRPPVVNGQRVEGAIKVTNGTDTDFDLTEIVMAVNEIGRATALGYQHFKLTAGTEEFEIPFGENLPSGAYQLHVDAVAEVPETNTIYRARLTPEEKTVVQKGP